MLSSIGIFAAVMSVFVILIKSLTLLIIVPVTVSAACALANWLCYYAFYTTYAIEGRMAASILADLTYMVGSDATSLKLYLIFEIQDQEVGISFYAYQILIVGTTKPRSFSSILLDNGNINACNPHGYLRQPRHRPRPRL